MRFASYTPSPPANSFASTAIPTATESTSDGQRARTRRTVSAASTSTGTRINPSTRVAAANPMTPSAATCRPIVGRSSASAMSRHALTNSGRNRFSSMSVVENNIDGSSRVSAAAARAESSDVWRWAHRYTGTAVSAITTAFSTLIQPYDHATGASSAGYVQLTDIPCPRTL